MSCIWKHTSPVSGLQHKCIPSEEHHAAMLQRDGGGATPAAAQPTASGTPAANALLALAASGAPPSHPAEAEATDANGVNEAGPAASSGVHCMTPALFGQQYYLRGRRHHRTTLSNTVSIWDAMLGIMRR